MLEIINLEQAEPFITKDGSEIRELLAHRNSSIRNQSLAEARVASGGKTAPHYHPVSEEIYYILAGEGIMQMRAPSSATWETRQVVPGDAIAIPPGMVHAIANPGSQMLHLLCCCAPGYEHLDTILVADE